MNILETALYLENLSTSLAETARLSRQLKTGKIMLIRDARQGWGAIITGKVLHRDGSEMPNATLPLPFTADAPAEAVARDMADRFPDAAIIVRLD